MSNTYFGGKGGAGVYQTLINQIPPHRTYISAFAGHDAVLQHIAKPERAIAIDLDPEPLRWWSQAWPQVELYQSDGVAWLRHHFGLDRFREESVDIATSDPAPRDREAVPGHSESGDESSFVMIDPPYPAETRTSAARYQYELDGFQHAQLLATAISLPCRVMVCSYPNEIYNDVLKDWRTVDYFSTVRSGDRRRERIWLNYPEPTELHDYRYLGQDKREREKIRRRCSNWVAGLARMPEHERNALLQAIGLRYHPHRMDCDPEVMSSSADCL